VRARQDSDLSKALRDRGFVRALIAQNVSIAGSWMQFVAAGFLVYDLTSNAVLLAILAVINRGPSVVLALPAGRIADRPDAMRVAMALLAVQAAGGVALGVSVEAGADSLAVIYVISTVMGVAAALNGPALQVVVPAAAPPSLHDEAVRLNSSGYNVARAAGPLIGGLLLGTAPAGASSSTVQASRRCWRR